MDKPKIDAIYGGVTFEQYEAAAQTVSKFLNGWAQTFEIRELIKDEHRANLKRDAALAAVVDMSLSGARNRFREMVAELTKELKENTTEPENTETL